ncbi:hypothetical protein PMAA_033250 [Talaromyces marneffei ATCC 18224]|uniref:Uncharacterized protein n=2 Tax=Talaromyces marneffei TaxID=37727 RepID=B6Q5X9_TALMQ|nr:hypothetical protein PMAA_033250 [Talaromyces marneffei ATCC 18224]
MVEYRPGEYIKFKPQHDPNIDHRGYIVQVMKDEKGVPTGVYLVEDRDWGPVEVHESDIMTAYT